MKLSIKNIRSPGGITPWVAALLILLALIIFLPALFGYHSSKTDLLNIWQEQGKLISETILQSCSNIMAFDEEAHQSYKEHLMDLGNYVRQLDSLNYPWKRPLVRYVHSQLRLDVFFYNEKGEPESLFRQRRMPHKVALIQKHIQSFISNDTLNTKVKVFSNLPGDKIPGIFIIIRRATGSGFIALVQRLGPGHNMLRLQRLHYWLDQIVENPSILYVQLLKDNKILARSGILLPEEPFYPDQSGAQLSKWRLYENQDRNIFEYTQRGAGGIYARIGFSTDALDNLQKNLIQRLLTNSLLLLILGSILTIYILKRQNFTLLSSKYRQIQTYTGSILQNMDEGIIVLNDNREITICNQAAFSLLNIDSINPVGLNILDISTYLPEDMIARFAKFEHLTEVPLAIKTAQKTKHLLITANRIIYHASENTDDTDRQIYIILLRDYTSQKELEAFRSRKSKLVAMGQLASRVAHEIRNPLNGIGVLAQRLQREFIPDKNKTEYKQMANSIRHETGRINNIIESFLAYARSPVLKLEKLDLKRIILDLQPLLQSLGQVDISFSLDDACFAEVDNNQFRQVIINLVKNAVEASPENGKVRLGLEHSNKQILLIVEDNGPDIADELKDKIFDLYYTTKDEGSGLGLSIVEKIVSAHGGRVWFESPYLIDKKEMNGTRFIVELPSK